MSYVLNLEQIPSEQFSFEKDRLVLLNRGDIHEISDGSIGSVDLTKVVGATHPNYGGLDWGTLKPVEDRDQCYLARSKDILFNLKKTPEYYLSQEKKQGWAFFKIGDEYYIDEGVHRTVLARLFLSANQLPQVVHGVTITEAIWKDEQSEAVRIYVARETWVAALKEKGIIKLGDLTNLDSLGRYKVADECWEISSISARQALLNDAHPQVRATATSSQQQAFGLPNEFKFCVLKTYEPMRDDHKNAASPI